MNFKLLRLVILFEIFSIKLSAQNKKLISGSVTDYKTGQPIPFASISLKHQLIGSNSNENGSFDFYFPQEVTNDSIIISCLGFKSKTYSIETAVSPLDVKLEPGSVALSEVVIRALSPVDYIRSAMRKVKENYPQKPFQSEAYYREKVLENDSLIKQTEGIFQTYYPSYQDTIKNQHQLLLYKKADPRKIAFMHDKAEKKKEKKIRKAKRQGKDTAEMENSDAVKIGFGGPEGILSMDFIKEKEPFLDTLQFNKFNYSFAGSSSYQGKELMVIAFDARKTVDHLKAVGKIYLDLQSLAVTSIEYKADFEIPLLIRPVLFLYGVSIEDAVFEKKLQYHELNGTWYPKDFQWKGKGSITKKHWFSANEHADFNIEQLFFINKMQTENAAPIPGNKRFKADKKIEDQVNNDAGITWNEINQVQTTGK
ncbi:MAG: carboxypeptidase-like regulatory domain-containing protein [Bacteroidota bacterium]